MILVDLCAGVALILLGVRFLRKGLDRFFGGRLFAWLRRMTANRFSALSAGIVAGALSASSTGLSLLTAQILNEGNFEAENIFAILLGGNIGITFLAHLVSFNLSAYSGLFLALGALGFLFSRNQKIRGVGQCLLALGFIFLSMQFIGIGTSAIGKSRDMNVILVMLDNHPVVLTLIAMVFAVLMQSSTASIALGVGLTASSTLNESDLLPWVLGTNLGLAVTALIVCWKTRNGRQLGYANLMVKVGVVLLFGGAISLGFLSPRIGSFDTRHLLPLWHTIFNLIAAVLALPFLRPLLALAERFVPDEPEQASEKLPETFLDPQALESPAIALANATRETLRMADDIRLKLHHLALARKSGNAHLARKVQNSDDTIDDLNQNIMLYLGQLGEDLTDYDRKWQLIILNFSNELETSGDIIEKNLCDAVIKQITNSSTVEEDEFLDTLFAAVIRRLDIAAHLISDRNIPRAKELITEKNKTDLLCLQSKQARLGQARSTDRQDLYATLGFLDMLEALQRVNSHISSIAYLVTSSNGRSRRAATKRSASDETAADIRNLAPVNAP